MTATPGEIAAQLTPQQRVFLFCVASGDQAPSGARYVITVDGQVRTHRDAREAALETANVLKVLRLYAKVMIRDLQNGAGDPGLICVSRRARHFDQRSHVVCLFERSELFH
jgi:hypothetical protein